MHIKYHILNMLKMQRDANQQYLIIVDLHFVKSKYFLPTWSCGSRKRDTTSSEGKFQLNNLGVKAGATRTESNILTIYRKYLCS